MSYIAYTYTYTCTLYIYIYLNFTCISRIKKIYIYIPSIDTIIVLYQYYFNISNTEFIRIYKISFPPIPSAVPTLSRLMRLRVSTAFQALRASSRDDQINLVLCFIWFHDVNFEIWLILHTNVCILYIYYIYLYIHFASESVDTVFDWCEHLTNHKPLSNLPATCKPWRVKWDGFFVLEMSNERILKTWFRCEPNKYKRWRTSGYLNQIEKENLLNTFRKMIRCLRFFGLPFLSFWTWTVLTRVSF